MTRKNKLEIYLSGACIALADEGDAWREEVIRLFSKYNDGEKINCFSPNRFFNHSDKKPTTDKECLQYFLHRLRNSDLVLVNLDDSAKSVGTGIEVSLAKEWNIPVIGFVRTKKDVYSWTNTLCDVVIDGSLESVVEYVTYFYCN